MPQPCRLLQPTESLEAQAARLWPTDARMRAKWLQAVTLLRRTGSGWLLDKHVERTGRGSDASAR